MIMVAILIVSGILLIVFGFYGLDLPKAILKGKFKNKGWGRIFLAVGIFFLMIGLAGLYHYGAYYGNVQIMRQRLNEPVISEAQLYGYEVVGKHGEEYGSSDDTSYFIDIRDTLTNIKTLKHIEVSQQLFERIEIGNTFDWSLMGKLKASELETPAPQDL